MANLSDRFNEWSHDDIDTVIQRGQSFADPRKRGIFSDVVRGLDQELDDAARQDQQYRLTRVLQDANRHRRNPLPEDGIQPLTLAITQEDVGAMAGRAQKLGITIDQITPQSQAEIHIRAAWTRVTTAENKASREREKSREETIRYAYRAIGELPADDLTQDRDSNRRPSHGLQKGDLVRRFAREL